MRHLSTAQNAENVDDSHNKNYASLQTYIVLLRNILCNFFVLRIYFFKFKSMVRYPRIVTESPVKIKNAPYGAFFIVALGERNHKASSVISTRRVPSPNISQRNPIHCRTKRRLSRSCHPRQCLRLHRTPQHSFRHGSRSKPLSRRCNPKCL